MGKISRRAADELKRTVQVVKGLTPKGAGFADPGMPIRLAKTTASHAAGSTQDVTLLWGEKGAESEGTARQDTVPAYNRHDDIDADTEVHIARIGPGWEIIGGRRLGVAGCEACNSVSGDSLTVTVSGEVSATAEYKLTPKCGGGEWTFTWDSSLTWNGTASDLSLDCGEGSPRTMAGTMVVTNTDPGGVVIEITTAGPTVVARFENYAAWQPCAPMRMKLVSYDPACPCAGWDQWPCLTPVEVV